MPCHACAVEDGRHAPDCPRRPDPMAPRTGPTLRDAVSGLLRLVLVFVLGLAGFLVGLSFVGVGAP